MLSRGRPFMCMIFPLLWSLQFPSTPLKAECNKVPIRLPLDLLDHNEVQCYLSKKEFDQKELLWKDPLATIVSTAQLKWYFTFKNIIS